MKSRILRSALLFPGILGEDRRLVQLRTELSKFLSLQTISYPDVTSATERLTDIDIISEYILDHTATENNSLGDIILVGYSFGGCIALELARLLFNEGHSVGGVVIIDAPLPGMTFDLFRPWTDGELPPRALTKRYKMAIIHLISLNRRVRLTILGLCGWIAPNIRRKLDRWMCKALRESARSTRWKPNVVDLPGIIIVSTQFANATYEGWRKLCPRMSYEKVEADHLSILEGDALKKITCTIENWISSTEVIGEKSCRRAGAGRVERKASRNQPARPMLAATAARHEAPTIGSAMLDISVGRSR